MNKKKVAALLATFSLMAAALVAWSSPTSATAKPATISMTASAPAAGAKAQVVTTRAVLARVTPDYQYYVDGNLVYNNAPDYDVDVLWYRDDNECGSSSTGSCYVPKAIRVTSVGPFPCDIERIDGDYVRGSGSGTIIQRIGQSYPSGTGDATATFTSGTWSYNSQDPRVQMKAKTRSTSSGVPGCSPSGQTAWATIRN